MQYLRVVPVWRERILIIEVACSIKQRRKENNMYIWQCKFGHCCQRSSQVNKEKKRILIIFYKIISVSIPQKLKKWYYQKAQGVDDIVW